MLTITSEHLSYEYNFERKYQDNIYPYNQSFEQPEEELIYFKGEQKMEPKTISSENVKN